MLQPIPDSLREAFQRWHERAAAEPQVAQSFAQLSPALCAELPSVVAASEFVGGALLSDPQIFAWLESHSDAASAARSSAEFERRAAQAASATEAQSLLRNWRRRALVRIAWQDIVGHLRVDETLDAVSELADGCIRAAAKAAQRFLQLSFGVPRDAQGREVFFIVLAMGKLGGHDLNFSSDIDLVFLFGEGGETDGERRIDNAEYFERLGRELIRLLDARTADGFVFRVDMRLRPFGDSGALVVNLAALEAYLSEHGRDWERYAWIKARAVVGAEAYASAAHDFVHPFVYRRYLDFGVFDSLRDMKELIAREVARREMHDDIKLGSGGIREIEFIVQSMQLVRGGNDRRLQTGSLAEVLPLLAGAKLLSPTAVAELLDAYRVLRKTENALQMIRDEQTHSLPTDALDRARVALNLGVPDWPTALARIDRARSQVVGHFGALLFGQPETIARGTRNEAEMSLGWLESQDIRAEGELTRLGFPSRSIAPVAALLESYRRSRSYLRFNESARRRVHVILARLLVSAAARPEPAAVVQRFMRVLDAIGARSSYLALLREQPAALARLIDVCALSSFLAAQIADFPLLLDELIDPLSFETPPSRSSFTRELAARTERLPAHDLERYIEALRQFQKVAVFGVAFADLTGRLPLMRVSDRLTEIAELIVERCVSLAWDQMTDLHGVPECHDESRALRPVSIAVAGYGKLGGRELSYGSDLDLVFLHDSHGDAQQTNGQRPLDNGTFLLRFGQRTMHLLTMHSAAGRLYEVDMRLRPNGNAGFLVTGIDAFERYQRREAWTWEHQALLRARAIAGDAALCRRFETVRRSVLSENVRRSTLRKDVADMRLRMRRELSKAHGSDFDIKQDSGGLADIEFLVQYWVLDSAAAHPELLSHSDNVRQLEGLEAAGVIDGGVVKALKEAYIDYRAVLHRLILEDGERVVAAAPHGPVRRRIETLWRDTMESNPLLEPWPGRFGGTPPFDRVRVHDFEPAFKAAMLEQQVEIERIAGDPATPTFENTLVALERAGATFKRVNSVYEIWSMTKACADFQAVERTLSPKIAAFHDKLLQNAALFARIEAIESSPAALGELTAEQRRLCWHTHRAFVRAGARASIPAKLRIGAINERLASLYASFSQNLLADEKDEALYMDDSEMLAGLSPDRRAAAAASAAALGRPGQWAVTNTRSAVEPFLTYAERRDLREQAFRMFYGRGNHGGPHDNKAIVTEILALRAERAHLLGFATHAHWRLADSMAEDPDSAMALLLRVWPAALKRARQEIRDMQQLADAEAAAGGQTIRIEAWDYRFYAEKIRRSRFDLDMNQVKQYLQLERMRDAMFFVAGELYGLRFIEIAGLPVLHPEIQVWEVRSAQGQHAGLWYFDPYARAGKSSGAWMSEYRDQQRLAASSPIVSNNTNFIPSGEGEPVLLSWEDAVTLFHEFGHALHGLNSNVEYPTLSGTHVVRDFVEFPSQLNEHWLATPSVLSRFALHARSGEPMPPAFADKVMRARTFNQGFATVEYLAAALFDLKAHLYTERVEDPEGFERETLEELGMPREIVMRHRTTQFAHIFAGDAYSAGYYSYLWAEVLDHDAFEAFTEAGGPFDKGVAKRLRDEIMCVGNSVDPKQAYRKFRGRDPSIEALLRARGFVQSE